MTSKRPLADLDDWDRGSLELDKKFSEVNEVGTLLPPLNLSWSELWPSILSMQNGGIEQPATSDVVEDASEETSDPSKGVPTVVEVSNSIQAWVEKAMPTHAISDDTGTTKTSVRSAKCFGMIHASPTRLIGDLSIFRASLSRLKPEQTLLCMRVDVAEQFAFLLDGEGNRTCQLNENLAKGLIQISGCTAAWFEGFANIADIHACFKRATRPHDSVVKIDINVYGCTTEDHHAVGQILSSHKIYLQHTIHRKDEFEYDNPHMVLFDDLVCNDVAIRIDAPQTERSSLEETVTRICEAETQDRGLKGLKQVASLKTILRADQEQALEFMILREIGPISEDFQLWRYAERADRPGFKHLITGSWSAQQPSELGGGILADDMGMGKSLSTLSLITRRLAEAADWSRSATIDAEASEPSRARSRATLTVVPAILIMNEWFKEVSLHLDGSLTIVKYHGKSRHKQVSKLTDCDIVLTTYHTLAADRKSKRCPLKSIKWFRIVLDEAHVIRRQSTTLFAAVFELEACHRWCLSGTPIQNTLADLGSLLAFLRIEPFDRSSLFRKHIISVFSEDRDEATTRLQTLLNSVCLRRGIHRLQLPPLDEHVRYIDFTLEERTLYKTTSDEMMHAATYGSREHFSNTPFGMFQIQLQLRLLCNHGTFERPSFWSRHDRQSEKEDALSTFGVHGELVCSRCEQKTLTIRTNCTSTPTQALRSILCDECIAEISDNSITLPDLSGKNSCTSTTELSGKDGSESCKSAPPASVNEPHQNRGGYSTKVNALVNDILDELSSTKSIVFSEWTRSQNLVALHLQRSKIPFVRIDGDTPISQRQSILNTFKGNENIRVLLMTTGTGAYGLNLADANRVFILEPQWNPSIENQAVGRLQRYLQTRSVKVVRYIVRDTIEMDVRRQQIRKMDEAERGFQS